MDTHRAVVEEFTQRVVSTLGDQVESVILYGSVARGDAGPDSDIDILVVGDDKRRLNGVAKQIASDLGREGGFTSFISPFEIERDELADLKRLGSPFIRNVLTDGQALYVNEASAGIHNLLGLRDMPTECSPEYIAKQLEKADEALAAAEYLVEGGHLRAVANRAYYAMFYAALAALMKSGGDLPRTHGGVENQFGLRYVTTGIIDAKIAGTLQDTYDLRRMNDYELYTSTADEVELAVRNAQAFVAEIRRVTGL